MTVKQLINGLKKYSPNLVVVQGGVPIKAMRLTATNPDLRPQDDVFVVRLIRQDEKRA